MNRSVKAVTIVKPDQLEITEINLPETQKDEVLISVKRAGICGSDIHIYHGSNPFISYPMVIGHEFVGVVQEIGSDVENIKPGDHVVVDPVISCGKCYQCAVGRPNVCADLISGIKTLW